MFRLSAFVLGLGVALAPAAQAADSLDYPSPDYPEMRGTYEPQCCTDTYDDPLSYEFSLRYVYSRGENRLKAFGGTYESQDTSHMVEVQGRIDDDSTKTYLEGAAGLAAAIKGTYDTPATSGDEDMVVGKVARAVVDFGYLPFGNDHVRMGGFVGYQYNNESADMGRTSYLNATGGGNSENNDLYVNALRLGLATKADFDVVDFRLEAAAIPFAKLSGKLGALSVSSYSKFDSASGKVKTYEQGSPGTVDGALYGGTVQASVGLKASDHLKFTFGGRLSYLTGYTKTTADWREQGNQGNSQGYISSNDNASFFRYGIFGGIGGAFN